MAGPLIAKELNLKRPKFKVMYVTAKVDSEALELALNDGYAIGNVSGTQDAVVYVLVKQQ
jgi:hypothetical protein